MEQLFLLLLLFGHRQGSKRLFGNVFGPENPPKNGPKKIKEEKNMKKKKGTREEWERRRMAFCMIMQRNVGLGKETWEPRRAFVAILNDYVFRRSMLISADPSLSGISKAGLIEAHLWDPFYDAPARCQ